MKNNNIKDTFELFSPTEERKEKIYKSIFNNQKDDEKRKGLHFKAKLAYSLVACFILVAVVAVLLNSPTNNNGRSLLDPEDTYSQANKPSENSSLPVATDKNAVFQGFILTAYTAKTESSYLNSNFMDEADKQVLTPDVKVLLAKYSPAMSSVPGLPFTVDLTDSDKNNHEIYIINVSVDYGELNRWSSDTGVVSSGGQETTINIGETIYWSPNYDDDNASVDKITITIKAVANDTVIGRQSIYITQDEPGYYYATIGGLELL
jgi:hypothetical protein